MDVDEQLCFNVDSTSICLLGRPRVKFSILIRVEKKLVSDVSFNPGQNEYLFYFISHRRENIYGKNCGMFYKNVLRKKTFGMQLQDYIKAMMLDCISNRIKMLNFKTFKIALLATINSKNVTASLLLNLYATKDLWSKKATRYSCRRCHDFEEYCVWKSQPTKEEVCKKSFFWL